MNSSMLSAARAELLEIVKEANGAVEVAGLGILAAPSLDNIQAKLRAGKGGDVESKRLIKSKYHDAVELGGLGTLAAPYIHKKLTTGTFGA